MDVHVPEEYVPLAAVSLTVGSEYVRNETEALLVFVRPRESVAVTVTERDPAARALEEVTSEPVPVNAPLTAYEDIDAPLPAVAEDCALNFVYPPTYRPFVFIQALLLTGDNVMVGAVGLIELPTLIVAS